MTRSGNDEEGAPHGSGSTPTPDRDGADRGVTDRRAAGPSTPGSSARSNGRGTARREVDLAPLKGPLADAFKRINRALDALDKVVESHLENHMDTAAAAAEVQRMNADRARLARTLDESEARTIRLGETNREVSHRLVAAMETVRSVLEREDGG